MPTPPATPIPTPTAVPGVRVVYAIPADREARQDFEEAVGDAVYHVQSWYAGQLDGLTFSVSDPMPQRCDLPEVEAYYSDGKGWSWSDSGRDRIMRDLQDCVPVKHWNRDSVWVIYPDVDLHCDGSSLGGAGGGVVVLHRGDLEGLINPNYELCGAVPRGPLGWVGGLAHELGHAFGLSHPHGCDEGVPETYKMPPVNPACDAYAVMWLGFYFDYPEKTYLTDIGKAHLQSSRFFHQRHE